jgi:cytochrome c oxidase subunit 2
MPETALFPPAASVHAGAVDTLFLVLLAICALITGSVFGMVGFFTVKYRRRSPGERGAPNRDNRRLEIGWTAAMVVIDVVLFAWGTVLFLRETGPPADAMPVYVVGQQWMWKVEHPDGRRQINELTVPVGRSVKLIMTSQDVIHSFYVPAFRLKMDVYPGRFTWLWFEATKPGDYHLLCAQYCGTDHARMRGLVHVVPADEYERWARAEGTPSMAERGRTLFASLGCAACHGERQGPRGPSLQGLFGRMVELQDGTTVRADETYLRQSVLRPQAQVVRGEFESPMPSYQGQVSEEDVTELIAWLKDSR